MKREPKEVSSVVARAQKPMPANHKTPASRGPGKQDSSKKAIHVLPSTYTRFKRVLGSANQKRLGRRSTHEDVVAVMLDFIEERKLIDELQKRSLRTKDHTQQLYEDYCKSNGNISYDEFIFKALTKQIDVDVSSVTSTTA